MATIQEISERYSALCRFCDTLWQRTANRYPEEIACRTGCADCCGLETVCALEAYHIGKYYDDPAVSLKNLSLHKSGGDHDCALLHEKQCSIYPARPIICRTHGLPIRSKSLTGGLVDCCPLNFNDRDVNALATDDILDLDMLTDNLMRLNLAFCLLLGEQALAAHRYHLEDIRGGKLPDKLNSSRQQDKKVP